MLRMQCACVYVCARDASVVSDGETDAQQLHAVLLHGMFALLTCSDGRKFMFHSPNCNVVFLTWLVPRCRTSACFMHSFLVRLIFLKLLMINVWHAVYRPWLKVVSRLFCDTPCIDFRGLASVWSAFKVLGQKNELIVVTIFQALRLPRCWRWRSYVRSSWWLSKNRRISVFINLSVGAPSCLFVD